MSQAGINRHATREGERSHLPGLLMEPIAWEALAVVGIILTFLGLMIDAWRHNTVSGEESLLSFSNPGHTVAAIGLGLVVAGVLMSLTVAVAGEALSAQRLYGQILGRLSAVSAAWILVVAAVSASLTYIAATGTSVGHSHDGSLDAAESAEHTHGSDLDHKAVKHDHGRHATYAEILTLSDAELVPRFPGNYVTGDDLPLLRAQLRQAAEAAVRFPTIQSAIGGGYTQATTDVDSMGIHYLNIDYVTDGLFDPARPEGLLFSRIDGDDPTLVGVWFLQVPGVGNITHDVEPDGFAGKMDYWHGHQNVCLPFETEGGTEAGCKAQGGRFVVDSRWMMHAWVVDGDTVNQDGVFSYLNPYLYEQQIAYHAGAPDSDGDGVTDQVEIEHGTDPIVAQAVVNPGVDATLSELRQVVARLPDGALEEPSIEERARLLGFVDGARAAFAAGDAAAGAAQIGHLASRLDDCRIHSERANWMEHCTIQLEARILIDELSRNLPS